jgi:ribosomal protein L12E/L44/L45/RPP1/RPP2
MTSLVVIYLITPLSEKFSMQINKSDLQKIIREEYARVLLEKSGHKITEARVRLIAERMETGDLDEALSDIWGGIKAVAGKAKDEYTKGKEAAKGEREKAEESDRQDKNRSAVASVQASVAQKIDGIIASIAKDLKSKGYKADEADIADIAGSLFGDAAKKYASNLSGAKMTPQDPGAEKRNFGRTLAGSGRPAQQFSTAVGADDE